MLRTKKDNRVAAPTGRQPVEAFRSRKVRMALLIAVCLVCAAIYIGWGLTPKNIGFNLPRRALITFTLVVISCAVGMSSTVFQTITETNILTPSVMGFDQLYIFIQALILYMFGAKRFTMMQNIRDFLITVAVMVFASCLFYVFMFRGRKKNIYFMVLIGMIIGQFFQSMTGFVQLHISPGEYAFARDKMFASYNNLNVELVTVSTILIGLVFLLALFDFRKLDALSLGREQSINLGINYQRLVLKHIVMIAVMVSVSTVLGGPVTFLGILVVNIARHIFQTYKHGWLISGSCITCVTALLLGQLFVERIVNFSAPSSTIINFVGGIYYIWLLLHQSKTKR